MASSKFGRAGAGGVSAEEQEGQRLIYMSEPRARQASLRSNRGIAKNPIRL